MALYYYRLPACYQNLQVILMKLKELEMCEKDRPVFKRWAVWLDHRLFKLDVES